MYRAQLSDSLPTNTAAIAVSISVRNARASSAAIAGPPFRASAIRARTRSRVGPR